MTALLANDDNQPLDQFGYVILNSVLAAEDVHSYATQLSDIGKTSAGSRCLLGEAWCRELAAQIRERLAEEFEEAAEAVAVQCTYFHKTAERNWGVPWHQDRAVAVAGHVDHPELSGWSVKEGMTFVNAPDALLSRMFAVRLQLDESTPDNGPLRVIPGSHRVGTLGGEQIETARAQGQETTCLVPKGGALVMRPLLLHASPKATSPAPRRVLHFWFGPRDPGYGLRWHVAA